MRPCIGKLPAGYVLPSGVTYGAQMFSKPQVKNRPPIMERCASSPLVSNWLRPFRPGLDRKVRFSPRYSNWQTSRARSAMDTKRSGPFFTSMALRPWARPSWYSIGRV